MKILFFIILSFLVSFENSAHQIPVGAAPFEKSVSCSDCHPKIYEEWKTSMHAMSSPHKNQAHDAVYQKFSMAMKEAGKPETYHCANCHTPMAENMEALLTGQAKPDKNQWKELEGTGCAFCHRIESIIYKEQFNQYRLNKDESYAVSHPSEKAPHKTTKSELFAHGQVCMGCHSHMVNPMGTPICVMKEEGHEGNCLTCHMPEKMGPPAKGSIKKTHTSHVMSGGRDPEMLRKSVNLHATIERREDTNLLTIHIQNTITHSFPSTNPMRMAFLKVTAFDGEGHVKWANFEKSPMKDKKSLFFKAFKGNDKVGVPAWKAESVAFDTRLKQGEKRSLSYEIPNSNIEKISVLLIYRLFAPKAIEMMGIPKDGINDKNYIVAKKEISL